MVSVFVGRWREWIGSIGRCRFSVIQRRRLLWQPLLLLLLITVVISAGHQLPTSTPPSEEGDSIVLCRTQTLLLFSLLVLLLRWGDVRSQFSAIYCLQRPLQPVAVTTRSTDLRHQIPYHTRYEERYNCPAADLFCVQTSHKDKTDIALAEWELWLMLCPHITALGCWTWVVCPKMSVFATHADSSHVRSVRVKHPA